MPTHLDVPRIRSEIERLGKELPPRGDPFRDQRFKELSEYLLIVKRDILRNIRPPISTADTSGLEAVLTSVTDMLSLKSVGDALPTSVLELLNTGYDLLDRASQYKVLAGHFFSKEVQAARRGRTSDLVDAEVEAVSTRATNLKKDILEYVDKLVTTLKEPGP